MTEHTSISPRRRRTDSPSSADGPPADLRRDLSGELPGDLRADLPADLPAVPSAASPEYRRDAVEQLQAYRLGIDLTRVCRVRLLRMRTDPAYSEVGPQLLKAVASIAANIAEGYSRSSVADRRKFYEYALGSAREVAVWFEALGLTDSDDESVQLTSIRRLLLTMIRTTRETAAAGRRVGM
jgi:four helix bundle protein